MTEAAQGAATPLDWITIEGFRSIGGIEKLDLRPINVLIGANGSGKSNFINTFSLLRAWAEDRLDDYVVRTGGADRNLFFGAKTTPKIHVETSFGEGAESHNIYFAATDGDRLGVVSESAGGEVARDYYDRPGDVGLHAFLRSRLKRWRVYHFHDTGNGARILRNAHLNDNRLLREDGENLSAFLYLLQQKERNAYRLIKRTFRMASPFFDDFVLEPLAHNEQMIRLEWRHRESDEHFDISTLSDGSLRFLALATLLLQPPRLRPSTILLDEPELGLHPYAIAMLCSLIRSVSVETQVVLATQSPYLVDQFQPEDIVVVDRVRGESRFKRLSTPELETWLNDYSLGDLWLKNEIGGRPAHEASAGPVD